jgi:hypothetical protein
MLHRVRSLLRKWFRRLREGVAGAVRRVLRRPRRASVRRTYTPPPLTTTEFIKIVGTPVPLVDGSEELRTRVRALRRVFDNPHHAVSGMQRRVAAALFEAAGARYLPGRLIDLLEVYDAFTATATFLSACGLRFETLVTSPDERAFFHEAIAALAEVDIIRRRAALNDRPLYETIRHKDLVRLEEQIERLDRAARVAIYLGAERSIVFPEYWGEFRARAIELINDWSTLPEDQVAEIYEVHRSYVELQRMYDDALRNIAELVGTLDARLPKSGKERRALEGIVGASDDLQRRVEGGSIEPGDGIEGLAELIADLEVLLASFGSGRRTGEGGSRGDGRGDHRAGGSKRGWRGGTPGAARIADSLLALGLSPDVKHERVSIKKAYRSMAMEHHPDRGGDADEFKRVSEAWELLREHMEIIGLDYIEPVLHSA